jgi:hypothetical protein
MNVTNRPTDEDSVFHFPQDPYDLDTEEKGYGTSQRQRKDSTIQLDDGTSLFLHVIRSDDYLLVIPYRAHKKRSNMVLRAMSWLSPCGIYKLNEWEGEDDNFHKHPLYPNLHIMTLEEISQLPTRDKVVHGEARITADPPRKSTKPYIRRVIQSISGFDILFPPLHPARKFGGAELEMQCNRRVFLFGKTVHTGPDGLFKTLDCASSTPGSPQIGGIIDSWHALQYYNDTVLNGFKNGPSSEALKALRVLVDLGTLKYIENTTFKYIYEYLADGIVGSKLSVACADFQLPIEALAFLANKGECGYYVATLILCAKGNHEHLMWSIFG